MWLLNERGARNLWVAAAPDYKGRRLTSYKEDDGQDIGMIEWTSDGKSIVFVRGGDLEHIGRRQPESAQSGSDAGTGHLCDCAVRRRRAEKARRRPFSRGFERRSRRVSFANGQIWMTNLDGEKPAEVVHSKAIRQSLRWSPDGTRARIRQHRGDHAFIGVYQAGRQVAQISGAVHGSRRQPGVER